MDWTKATIKQLRVIIESDFECPNHLLYGAFEEIVKRDGYENYIHTILKRWFGSLYQAEQLTKMTADEIKWHLYGRGLDVLKKHKPGNPFLAFWSKNIKFLIRDLVRDHQAQKRTADIVEIDSEDEWIIPAAHFNTEKTVLNRMYIEFLFSKLTETEKEIILMRNAGYTMKEIGEKQGITKTGVQKRIQLYLKKLKKDECIEFNEII